MFLTPGLWASSLPCSRRLFCHLDFSQYVFGHFRRSVQDGILEGWRAMNWDLEQPHFNFPGSTLGQTSFFQYQFPDLQNDAIN